MYCEIILLVGFEFVNVSVMVFLEKFQSEPFFVVGSSQVFSLTVAERTTESKIRCFIHIRVSVSLRFDVRRRKDSFLLTWRKKSFLMSGSNLMEGSLDQIE